MAAALKDEQAMENELSVEDELAMENELSDENELSMNDRSFDEDDIPADLANHEDDSLETREIKTYKRWEMRGFRDDPPRDWTSLHLREFRAKLKTEAFEARPSHPYPQDTYMGEGDFFAQNASFENYLEHQKAELVVERHDYGPHPIIDAMEVAVDTAAQVAKGYRLEAVWPFHRGHIGDPGCKCFSNYGFELHDAWGMMDVDEEQGGQV